MMTFLTQRGAMFGMDARITVIIAMVVAVAVGINQMSTINNNRADETERRMERIQTATQAYATRNSTLPFDFLNDLNMATDQYGQPLLGSADDIVDAWGNAFAVITSTCETDIAFEAVILISAGKDGTFNDDYVNMFGGDCSEHVDFDQFIQGDDMYTLFSTYAERKKQFAADTIRLKEIMAKLEALAAHNRIRWQRICELSGTAQTGCDYDANGTYTPGEELSMNFYPYATEVVAGCPASRPFYADNAALAPYSSRSFTSQDLASMRTLMTLLGLPTSYAQNLAGAVLIYDSNDGNRCSAPFTARVSYF